MGRIVPLLYFNKMSKDSNKRFHIPINQKHGYFPNYVMHWTGDTEKVDKNLSGHPNTFIVQKGVPINHLNWPKRKQKNAAKSFTLFLMLRFCYFLHWQVHRFLKPKPELKFLIMHCKWMTKIRNAENLHANGIQAKPFAETNVATKENFLQLKPFSSPHSSNET